MSNPKPRIDLLPGTPEIPRTVIGALKAEARYVSDRKRRIAAIVAQLLKDYPLTAVAAAVREVQQTGYLQFDDIVRVAELLNSSPEVAADPSRGFAQLEWDALLRRARTDAARLDRALTAIEHDRSGGTVTVRPRRNRVGVDPAAYADALRHLEGRLVATVQYLLNNVVVCTQDRTQVILSTSPKTPITVEVIFPGAL